MIAGPHPPEALLHAHADPGERAGAAQALAAALGVDAVLLYVKDPQLDVMLPACGMPKTLAGGPHWREFLRRCLSAPRPAGTVDVGQGDEVAAQAIVRGGAALILLGGTPDPGLLAQVERELPLLAAVLVAQEALRVERAEATEARAAAAQAHDLARALDRARAASAELNLQLRQEHERKDEFLAMLSHELRNPLAPLVHSVELLRLGGPDRPLTMRQLDLMARQLQQLTRLVDDLLDVSRVSRGMISLQREQVLLQDVLDDAIEATRPLLEERRHSLHRTAAPPVQVNADRVRLTQVFANLLANAALYTDPQGRITVSVVPDQHRVSVVVQDTGIGIPQDMLTRVFDMFTQVASRQERRTGGLGIGLTLVRRLVELHGGRVSAYSRGPGQGSTFTVSLPQLHLVQGPRAPAAPQPRRVRPAAPLPPQGERSRVLVVDDNRDAAETIAAVIGRLGADVRLAHDGPQALQLAPGFDPHLVLLDIGLPGMDGYETARRLRQEPALRARLVALTGYGSPHDRERALAAGFDEHLVKPLTLASIEELLHRLPAMHARS